MATRKQTKATAARKAGKPVASKPARALDTAPLHTLAQEEASGLYSVAQIRQRIAAWIKTNVPAGPAFATTANGLVSADYGNAYVSGYMVACGAMKACSLDEAIAIRAKPGFKSEHPDRRTAIMEAACTAMRQAQFRLRATLDIMTEEKRGAASAKKRKPRTPKAEAQPQVAPHAIRAEVTPTATSAEDARGYFADMVETMLAFHKKNGKMVPAVIASALQDFLRIVKSWKPA